MLLGADRSTLGPMAEALAKERGRTIGGDQHPERGYFFRSDHFPFAKAGVPALSISEPREFHRARTPTELKKKQEAYNSTDYHQPSDEFDPSWDFSGAVDDMRLLAQLAWRIAAAAGDAAATTTAISSRTRGRNSIDERHDHADRRPRGERFASCACHDVDRVPWPLPDIEAARAEFVRWHA